MKDNKLLNIFCITLAVLALLITSCRKSEESGTSDIVKIEYDRAVKPVSLKGKVLKSYQVNYKKDISEASALKTARLLTEISGNKLNFEKPFNMGEGILALRNEKDPSASFEMNTRSGNFLFNGGLAEYKKDISTPNLITGNKAESIALQHLEKLKLLPDKNELQLINIGGLNMASLKPDKTTEIYQKLITVRYDRILSDLPVMGESRIVVHLGSKGKLAGLIYNWSKVENEERLGPDQLLSDKKIKKTIESRLRKGARGAKRIIVKKADIVLYDDGIGQIEPAYHIQARLYYISPDSITEKDDKAVNKYDIPFDFYVPVLKKPIAFYPYMETAKIPPSEASEFQITQKDNE